MSSWVRSITTWLAPEVGQVRVDVFQEGDLPTRMELLSVELP